eukprot:9005614-Alexandrium_andersonii.AAC.1
MAESGSPRSVPSYFRSADLAERLPRHTARKLIQIEKKVRATVDAAVSDLEVESFPAEEHSRMRRRTIENYSLKLRAEMETVLKERP